MIPIPHPSLVTSAPLLLELLELLLVSVLWLPKLSLVLVGVLNKLLSKEDVVAVAKALLIADETEEKMLLPGVPGVHLPMVVLLQV
jgi:hypothetical protein